MTDKDLDLWMDDISSPKPLPENKGIVQVVHKPVEVETKFGKRKKMSIVINGADGTTVYVNLFLPETFPMVHPKSNLAKILAKYGCKSLRELVGKEVEVVETGEYMWNIKI